LNAARRKHELIQMRKKSESKMTRCDNFAMIYVQND